ncbi:MAG: type II secretion system F family protein [Solirubrobacterales bacterium]|nr:type II secretion system F family protein [Solirubrobacterales bacterium]
MTAGPVPLLLGAVAGIAAVFAIGEIVAGGAGGSSLIESTLGPLRRARAEGRLPTSDERFRLAASAGFAAVGGGWWFGGLWLALPLAVAGPLAAGAAVRRGRRRYRRSIERSLPEVARAIADCLSAGDSPRGALTAAAGSLEGPARFELDLVSYELEIGSPTGTALRSLSRSLRSARVDAFVTAMVSQQVAGGDLASLLRRFADGAAERDRIAEDARSATAQARFTGYLVVAMPAGAALFAELLRPGFLGSLVASKPALVVVGLSMALQAAGFLAISRLATVGEP